MARFDEAKFALEAATNGKNTIILDDTGMPSVMVRIPCFRWCDVIEGGSREICSAFIAGGKVYDSIYVSKYLNIIENERAYSLPGRDPANIVTIDEAREACRRKGKGWHLMSNAEWAAVAHWSVKNGTSPRGNLNAGNNPEFRHEHGVRTWGVTPEDTCFGWQNMRAEDHFGDYEGNPPVGRTLTGISPVSWSHDGTDSGIFDLVGNIWDFVSGLRVKDGEIQIIPDNDSALNVDESENSPYWRAVSTDGRLVPPGSPGTYKYDGCEPGLDKKSICVAPGGIRINTEVEFPQYSGDDENAEYGFSVMPFEMLKCREGIEVQPILKELGLYPVSDNLSGEMLFMRSYGERMPARGASWYDGTMGGLWSLYLRDNREYCYPDIGFRACYIELE